MTDTEDAARWRYCMEHGFPYSSMAGDKWYCSGYHVTEGKTPEEAVDRAREVLKDE